MITAVTAGCVHPETASSITTLTGIQIVQPPSPPPLQARESVPATGTHRPGQQHHTKIHSRSLRPGRISTHLLRHQRLLCGAAAQAMAPSSPLSFLAGAVLLLGAAVHAGRPHRQLQDAWAQASASSSSGTASAVATSSSSSDGQASAWAAATASSGTDTTQSQQTWQQPQQDAFTMPQQDQQQQDAVVAPQQDAFTTPQQDAVVAPQQDAVVAPEQDAFTMPQQDAVVAPQQDAVVAPQCKFVCFCAPIPSTLTWRRPPPLCILPQRPLATAPGPEPPTVYPVRSRLRRRGARQPQHLPCPPWLRRPRLERLPRCRCCRLGQPLRVPALQLRLRREPGEQSYMHAGTVIGWARRSGRRTWTRTWLATTPSPDPHRTASRAACMHACRLCPGCVGERGRMHAGLQPMRVCMHAMTTSCGAPAPPR